MFYLKKSLMGYKVVENENDADFMAWSVSKGNELLEDLEEYKEKSKEYETKYIDLLGVKNDLNLKIKDLTSNLTATREELNKLKELLSSTLEELTIEKKKNANFLRISKERANADRGLTPKKQHNGYIELYREQIDIIKTIQQTKVINARQRTEIIKIKFPVWRYNFQTPYLATLPAEMVKVLIIKDFSNMGIEYNTNFEMLASKSQITNALNTNTFFNFTLNSKKNSKYWEIKFQSGQELKI